MASLPFQTYLFTVTFEDGSTITQGRQDVSKVRPDKSVWYDVENRLMVHKATAIQLISTFTPYVELVVDLTTGKFKMNTMVGTFNLEVPHEPLKTPTARPVYFRRNVLNFNPSDMNNPDRHVTHYVGWEQDDQKYVIGLS